MIAAVGCLLLALQFGGTASLWEWSGIMGLFVGFGLLSLTLEMLEWKLRETATTPLRICGKDLFLWVLALLRVPTWPIFTVRCSLAMPPMHIPLLKGPLACILYAFLLSSRTRYLGDNE